MVTVDALKHRGFYARGKPAMTCHLRADTDAELREFACLLGIPKAWEQTSTRTNILHYDLTRQWRELAVRNGAVEVRG